MKIKTDTAIKCHCGNPGTWHGHRNGRREFACEECWAVDYWYIDSFHVRGEPRFYVIKSKDGKQSPYDVTTNKALADRRCETLNAERRQA